jgi:hypothetical protein
MQRPYNQEKYDIQITVCPYDLTKQKQMLYALMVQKQVEWTDEMRESLEGLLNLLDYIQDEVKFRDDRD